MARQQKTGSLVQCQQDQIFKVAHKLVIFLHHLLQQSGISILLKTPVKRNVSVRAKSTLSSKSTSGVPLNVPLYNDKMYQLLTLKQGQLRKKAHLQTQTNNTFRCRDGSRVITLPAVSSGDGNDLVTL